MFSLQLEPDHGDIKTCSECGLHAAVFDYKKHLHGGNWTCYECKTYLGFEFSMYRDEGDDDV